MVYTDADRAGGGDTWSAQSSAAGYRFIPGPFQYSGGVGALPGFAIQRVRFTQSVPLADGFERIAGFLRDEGQPLTALCACELRSPAQFTDAGFVAFNRQYMGTLQSWGIVQGDVNPVARSNVCPEFGKPEAPSFYAFSSLRRRRSRAAS